MTLRSQGLRCAVCFAAVAGACLTFAAAQDRPQILIWSVRSPHTGAIPRGDLPSDLSAAADRLGLDLHLETFPAGGFAATFENAIRLKLPPDLITFDNYGIMEGMTTQLGRFEGIAVKPADKARLVEITRALDGLLGSARGWVFAYKPSVNYEAVRKLALRSPECAFGESWPADRAELQKPVADVISAFIGNHSAMIQHYADPFRIDTSTTREAGTAKEIRLCGFWGNDKLAFVSVNASYDSARAFGHTAALLIFRKTAEIWKLLVVSRDPISTGRFIETLRERPPLRASDSRTNRLEPAILFSPPPMTYPTPESGERFGKFTWRRSASNTPLEIAEFAYNGDARMLATDTAGDARGEKELSAGLLWHYRGIWQWRIWSIADSGDVAFSEARPFPVR